MPEIRGRGPSSGEVIMGIDPGTAVTGWAIVRRAGSRFESVEFGCIRTTADDLLSRRLLTISSGIEVILEKFKPRGVALEQAFAGKNVQSMMRLGEARGAILLSCARQGFPVYEYATASVKKAIVGSGRADKLQMQFMVQKLLNLAVPPAPLDASDALGLALTLGLDLAHPLAAEVASHRRS